MANSLNNAIKAAIYSSISTANVKYTYAAGADTIIEQHLNKRNDCVVDYLGFEPKEQYINGDALMITEQIIIYVLFKADESREKAIDLYNALNATYFRSTTNKRDINIRCTEVQPIEEQGNNVVFVIYLNLETMI